MFPHNVGATRPVSVSSGLTTLVAISGSGARYGVEELLRLHVAERRTTFGLMAADGYGYSIAGGNIAEQLP
jgi:hypothetical protein